MNFTAINTMTTYNQILVAILLIAAPALSQSSYANGMDELSEGAELFEKYCAACHGDSAIGQDPAQPKGGWDAEENQLAPALNGTGHAWHHPPQLLFDYIQKGSIDKTSPMPSFGAILSDTQIREIIAYFQSMWSEKIKAQYKARFTTQEE